MIQPCVRCKNQRNDLQNIRDNDDLEGLLIAKHPEVLRIDENEPLLVCKDCLAILNNREDNNNSIRHGKDPGNLPTSDNIPLQSESIGENIDVPFGESNAALSNSLDVEKLKLPGQVEKLVPNNQEAQRNIRNLLERPMPIGAKKRKLNEMLGEIAQTSEIHRSDESASQTVVEQRVPAIDYAEAMFERLTNQMREKQHKRDSRNNSLNYSQSSSSMGNNTVNANEITPPGNIISSDNVPIPLSPMINVINEPLVNIYQHDSSSSSSDNSVRVRNTRPRRSTRSSSLQPATNNSPVAVVQPTRNSSERQVSRRQNDGIAHSNVAAPRRVNLVQPVATRPIDISKLMGG